MSSPVTIVRVMLDLTSVRPALDVRTGATPRLPRSAGGRFEIAVGQAGLVVDISLLESIQFWLSDYYAPRSNPFIRRRVGTTEINRTLTQEQWLAGTHQHAVITVDDGDLDLDARRYERSLYAGFRSRWFGASGQRLMLGHTVLQIVEG